MAQIDVKFMKRNAKTTPLRGTGDAPRKKSTGTKKKTTKKK